MVAVFRDQHSVRLGHLASSQIVLSLKSAIVRSVAARAAPSGRGRLSQSGKRRRAERDETSSGERTTSEESAGDDMTRREGLRQRGIGAEVVAVIAKRLGKSSGE